MKLTPDTVIEGRYRVIRELGSGGMGIVYEGVHVRIGRRVAIKVLHAGKSRDAEVVERFVREARAATSIGHPHIVDVTDFGQLEDGSPYMVLEYLEGREWAHDLRATVPRPLHQTARIMVQVCRALGAAHAKGIVHRDLKPENVFLVEREEDPDFVKVLDFGISKLQPGAAIAEGGAPLNLTRDGLVVGTPYYMSPEQCRAARDIDHRTDIYSLGVILYRALTGGLPFDDGSYEGLVVKICTEPAPALGSQRPDLPPDVAHLLGRMLAKDRNARPPNCEEVESVLSRHVGPAETAPLPAPAAPSVAPPKPSRLPLFLVAVAIMALGLAIIGGGVVGWQMFLAGDSSERSPPVDAAAPPTTPLAVLPDAGLCGALDLDGCLEEGRSSEHGSGGPVDMARARTLYDHTCEAGLAAGCTHLGALYANGRGVPTDDARARALYQRSCDGGDPRGCSNLGAFHIQGRGGAAPDDARALALFTRACDGGFALACSNVGTFYDLGRGVPPDQVRARGLFERACEGGNAGGCTNLGLMHERGRGGPLDETSARLFYGRGCEAGHPTGCANLAVLLANGRGGRADVGRAVELLTGACQGGLSMACANLGVLYEAGQGVTRDYARSRELQQTACEGGYPSGCVNLGVLHRDGHGGPRDRTRARELFAQGCQAGDARGCRLARR